MTRHAKSVPLNFWTQIWTAFVTAFRLRKAVRLLPSPSAYAACPSFLHPAAFPNFYRSMCTLAEGTKCNSLNYRHTIIRSSLRTEQEILNSYTHFLFGYLHVTFYSLVNSQFFGIFWTFGISSINIEQQWKVIFGKSRQHSSICVYNVYSTVFR